MKKTDVAKKKQKKIKTKKNNLVKLERIWVHSVAIRPFYRTQV